MHRSSSSWVSRFPDRVRPRALGWHQRGVAATYKLHDRLLSNRLSRSRYADNRPSLDPVQRRIVESLDHGGYALASVEELLSKQAWQALQHQAAGFVEQTEANLEQLRQRKGKNFLVRKYEHGRENVLGLDDPWLDVCGSRRLLDIANEYLRLWSKVDYLDVWYSIPIGQDVERRASQLWHRDFEDRHLLKVFLYLVDVDEQTGPLEYVSGSQPDGPYADIDPWQASGISASQKGTALLSIGQQIAKRVPTEKIRTFTAPKGTMIFCNSSGLHRGGFAKIRPRVLATAAYTSPASLAALTKRNFTLSPSTDTSLLEPVIRYALD